MRWASDVAEGTPRSYEHDSTENGNQQVTKQYETTGETMLSKKAASMM